MKMDCYCVRDARRNAPLSVDILHHLRPGSAGNSSWSRVRVRLLGSSALVGYGE